MNQSLDLGSKKQSQSGSADYSLQASQNELEVSMLSNTQANNRQANKQILAKFLKLKKKNVENEGNSAFTRGKLDTEYNPKLNILRKNHSPYSNAEALKKRAMEKSQREEENTIYMEAKEQIRNGKQLIIDWSTKTNFRTTRFPSISDGPLERFKTETPSSRIKHDSQRKGFVLNEKSRILTQQIVQKSNYLRDLISKTIKGSMAQQRGRKSKLWKKNQLKTENNSGIVEDFTLSDKPLNSSVNVKEGISQTINESKNRRASLTQQTSKHEGLKKRSLQQIVLPDRLAQKEELFFTQNAKKISEAMMFEQQISSPLDEPKSRKASLEQIQTRIISKSKLTLLKSDLIKKFREIRESYLDEAETKNNEQKKK